MNELLCERAPLPHRLLDPVIAEDVNVYAARPAAASRPPVALLFDVLWKDTSVPVTRVHALVERRVEHQGGAFASSAAPRQCSHACACNGATLKRLVKPHPQWTPKELWERPPL